ncbi:putative zinc-responsive transcriptional regulator [Podospora australis]|uniref:Zinc-responsive transcriptional regulator n=1 Tax=Podospora australis TaxID=1536484 RepID=A0AAN6X4G4_9PEZI|nr:putative zinc-responsive transcriptional regulator [Podospora australis]
MDGSFQHSHSGRFAGYGDGFHRHSQSGSNHHHHQQQPSLDYHQLALGMPHMDNTTRFNPAAGLAPQSHDDLCVPDCEGIGVYNGFQQFNHRGAPLAMQSRWQQGRFLHTRDHSVPHNDFPIDLTMPMIPLQHQHQHQQQQQQQQQQQRHHHQFHHSDMDLSLSGYQQPCFDDHLHAAIMSHCEDEDCQSMDDSGCCDSQCTMTGKCTDIGCESEEDACTDQNCPSRPAQVPEEVRDGAAALISINHAPELSLQNFGFSQHHQQQHQHQQHQVCDLGFDMAHAQFDFLSSHLLDAHNGADPAACERPCPLDDPQIYRYCHMPVYNDNNQFDHFNSTSSFSSNLQMNQGMPGECGTEIHDPESFAAHFFAQHKDYYLSQHKDHFQTNNMNQLVPTSSTSSSRDGTVLASTETVSPPAPGLDISDTTASLGTPSPLTPLSTNIEMPDVKTESVSHTRSTSIASSGDDSVKLDSSNDEHRCLWREVGGTEICGLVFSDAEALFRHASNVHIKHAQKGERGFRCGWDDCPRSALGAEGFPQRSKIERHMQTHIGHKPHICQVCNKGFSAKQALTQHMFIHSNEKPLVCNICHKAFRYPSALTMHQRVHSGAKPLRCPICGKGFSESSNLSKHKRTHEVKGRFNCSVPGCDRNFHRQDQLRRHMKTHPRDSGDFSRSSEVPEASGLEVTGFGNSPT